MKASPRLELVSFKLCPFVQRAVITLTHKKVPFDITYIELDKKPRWFLEISPLGKVPVLKVDDVVLFESAVINEYLDETVMPRLHPEDPLQRARNRAWIEFASGLTVAQYQMYLAADAESFTAKKEAFIDKLDILEEALSDGPYFNGQDFRLIDTTYAPLFMRLALVEKEFPLGLLNTFPKVQAYSRALLDVEAVQKSVVPDFAELYIGYLKQKESYVAANLS